MNLEPLNKGEHFFLNLSMYVLISVVSVIAFLNAPTWAERWTALALLLVFAIVAYRLPDAKNQPRWHFHLYLTIQVVLTTSLLLSLSTTLFTLLFFILSAQAMLLLPTRQGLTWIVVMIVLTLIVNVSHIDWVEGGFQTLVQAAGYFFFGVFGNALVRADKARWESQQLLEELQLAHQQLQNYASKVEELTIVQERNRLSRDLHDTLGHQLTVSIVQLEGAERLLSSDPSKAANMVHTVREQLKLGLDEVRQTVAMLRSPQVTDLSLPKSLKKLTEDFDQATPLQIHTSVPDSVPSFPSSHRLAIYRAAQEGLTNIQRHAQAQNAWLSLAVAAEGITLQIRDDGQGFPEISQMTTATHSNGFGLRGMQERATQLGGQLKLTKATEGGTCLTFSLPYKEPPL